MAELTRQVLSDLLFDHQQVRGVRDMRARCTCGWVGVTSANRTVDYRAHLVEILYEEVHRG